MLESVNEIFEAAAAKYLTAVDAAPDEKSNQHEIGGLVKAGMGKLLGTGPTTFSYSAIYAYLPGESDSDDTPPVICEAESSWYDSRRKDPTRGPEYRLYYDENEVTEQIREGDLLVVAKNRNGSLALIFTPQGSPAEAQLRHLFGLPDLTSRMKPAALPEQSMILPVRLLLEEIGINPFRDKEVDDDLEMLLERFPKGLPKTDVLSGSCKSLSNAKRG